MEGDAGRDANKSFGYWAGLVTLRRSEKPENKVQFFEHPHNALLVEFGRHSWLRTSCLGIASSSLAGGT